MLAGSGNFGTPCERTQDEKARSPDALVLPWSEEFTTVLVAVVEPVATPGVDGLAQAASPNPAITAMSARVPPRRGVSRPVTCLIRSRSISTTVLHREWSRFGSSCYLNVTREAATSPFRATWAVEPDPAKLNTRDSINNLRVGSMQRT